jgi:hypothetical protein
MMKRKALFVGTFCLLATAEAFSQVVELPSLSN